MDNKNCSGCRFFKQFYSKAFYRYVKRDFGQCFLCSGIKGAEESCEKWKRKITDEGYRREIIYKAMKKTIKSIHMLQCILEEDGE